MIRPTTLGEVRSRHRAQRSGAPEEADAGRAADQDEVQRKAAARRISAHGSWAGFSPRASSRRSLGPSSQWRRRVELLRRRGDRDDGRARGRRSRHRARPSAPARCAWCGRADRSNRFRHGLWARCCSGPLTITAASPPVRVGDRVEISEGLASFRGGRHFGIRVGRDRVSPKACGRMTDISFRKPDCLLGSKFFRSGSSLRHERVSTKLRRKPRESRNVV